MDSNGQTMVTKVISAKEIVITCTFSTLEALNSVRKWSSTVLKVYPVLKTLVKLVVVEQSWLFPGDLLVPLWKSCHLVLIGC